jgi:hypothetical protein
MRDRRERRWTSGGRKVESTPYECLGSLYEANHGTLIRVGDDCLMKANGPQAEPCETGAGQVAWPAHPRAVKEQIVV